ncbi:MAG: hypothetical protein HZA53_12425, partial [Planctomycetes bacterium]|nr:hypothetical protein [Planctomycetota bacterium]
MNDLPPASNPAPQPYEPAPQYPAPGATPPPQPAYSAPYAPPLAAAAQPPPSTPPGMGPHAARGAPPPAGPGMTPIQAAWPTGGGAPPDYKTGATFMLVGSITTLIGTGIWFLCLVWVCFGCCWLPLAGVALWALVVAAQAVGGTSVRNIRLVNAFALVAAIFTLDAIGFVMQLLALIWFS